MNEEVEKIQKYVRATNYLSAGQIYLQNNFLLKERLTFDDIKSRLLGHWGASPALSFAYTHLNRVIRKSDINAIFMAGPGHGAPGVLAPVYLEGSYSEVYPEKSLDEEGLLAFFKQFSFPGGIGSHCTPETPGSIHEGGELGYVLSHAAGAAFDNPDLIVAAVVGDGDAQAVEEAAPADVEEAARKQPQPGEQRQRLAYDLARCFLVRSGVQPLPAPCPSSGPAAQCTASLDDKAFAVYTQFFTNSHSVCLFVANQVCEAVTTTHFV